MDVRLTTNIFYFIYFYSSKPRPEYSKFFDLSKVFTDTSISSIHVSLQYNGSWGSVEVKH